MRYFPTPRFITALSAFCVLGIVAFASYAQPIAIDKILAAVNEEPITLNEYRAYHQQAMLENPRKFSAFDGKVEPSILSNLIDARIQAQIAVQQKISVSPQEVNQGIALVARQNQVSVAELLKQLRLDGITAQQFGKNILEQQLIRKLTEQIVRPRVRVSPEEVTRFLNRHPEYLLQGESYELSRIVISLADKTETQIKADTENMKFIRDSLLKGRDFARAANEYSDAADSDGYMGWRDAAQIPPFILEVLREVKSGEISEIFRTANSLQLFKVHAHKANNEKIVQQFLRHILIAPQGRTNRADAKRLADELYTRIESGEDFATLAQTYSDDQLSGAKGGSLGWLNPGRFPPNMEEVVDKLKLNQVSKPIQSPSGYHLVEVLERRRIKNVVAVAREEVEEELFRRKAKTVYENWLRGVRANAHIEYLSVEPS